MTMQSFMTGIWTEITPPTGVQLVQTSGASRTLDVFAGRSYRGLEIVVTEFGPDRFLWSWSGWLEVGQEITIYADRGLEVKVRRNATPPL